MGPARSIISALAGVAACAALGAGVMNHREPRPAAPVVTVAAPRIEPAAGVSRDGAPTVDDSARAASAQESDVQIASAAERASEELAAPPGRDGDRKKIKKAKRKWNREADARRRTSLGAPAHPGGLDPDAREASAMARRVLPSVGLDPTADAAWADAINDPSRTAHERSDLIEDLNEEGFPDPAHVTPDDLPLIERRLALIEQYAAQPMDDANAEAFAEAYNDLLGMYLRASEDQSPQDEAE